LDLDRPSRIAGWRNRDVVAHLAVQPVLLARFLAGSGDQGRSVSPSVTLVANLSGTTRFAAVIDASAREGGDAGRLNLGAHIDAVLPVLESVDLTGTITTFQGSITVVDYLITRCLEAVVHGGDLVDPVEPDRDALRIASHALIDVLAAKDPALLARARQLDPQCWVNVATGRDQCAGELSRAMPLMT
ncbi:MAG: maleylpyruvate isomerase N-terminal domain-containing protein, partial [Acidimicrobiales bacterium]